MIIINEKEMRSEFTEKEKRIIDIRSTKSVYELYDMLLKGEDISEVANITSYKYGDEITFYDKPEDLNMDAAINQSELEELRGKPYERPFEFKMFELYQFNQATNMEYQAEEISKEDLITELKMAMNCLPTLLDKELTSEEVIKYRDAGLSLVKPGEKGIYPTINEIDKFMSFNDYEKRLIINGYKDPTNASDTGIYVHPYKAFKIIEAAKDKMNNFTLTTDDYRRISHSRYSSVESISNDFATARLHTDNKSVYENLLNTTKHLFEEEYNFVPRVLSEYVYGWYVATNGGISANELVDKFNRTSVSKVANTKNPFLLALSSEVNFNEISAKLKDVLAVYLTAGNYYKLYKAGFPEWLNKNKNVTPVVLQEIIENFNINLGIDKIDVSKNAKTLLKELKNAKGMRDAKKFEQDPQYKEINGKIFKFADNTIAISGRHLVAKQGKTKMYMLGADDYRNFTAGYDTTCCQHYGDAGASCVYKAVTDPFAATVVIEEDGIIKAQGFVWTDENKNTLVFDNIEFTGANTLDTQLAQKYQDIIYEWCKESPYKNIHIGTGYNAAMNGWGICIKDKKNVYATLPTTIDNKDRGWTNCYSDYHSNNARIVKDDGKMLLNRRTTNEITTEMEDDEPTIWDDLKKPGIAFLLNDCKRSVEDRIRLSNEFYNEQTPESQMAVVKLNPESVAEIDNPTEEVQLYILNNKPNLCDLIKNPIPAIQHRNIYNNPKEILKIENPPLELIEIAISGDGLILQYFSDIGNPEIYREAVKQNPFAIKYVPESHRTEALEMIAVEAEPKIAISTNLSERATMKALELNPDIISEIKEPPFRWLLAVVRANPSKILDINYRITENETPEEHNSNLKELWETAVAGNGYLIRNCAKTFPEFRALAIRQNPFTIGCLKDPTEQEIEFAVRGDKKVPMFIKDKEKQAYAYSFAKTIYNDVPVKKQYTREEREIEVC